jgi:hypothetical protein
MSTIDPRHGRTPALVAALAVAGMLAATGLAGVAWHEHHHQHSGASPGSHLVLPYYPPPVPPGGWAIHHAQQRVGEVPAWPTRDGRRVQLHD